MSGKSFRNKNLRNNSENLGLRFFLHFDCHEDNKGNEDEEKQEKKEDETSTGVDTKAAEGESGSRGERSEVDREEKGRGFTTDHFEADNNKCERQLPPFLLSSLFLDDQQTK